MKQVVQAEVRDETRRIIIVSGAQEPPPLPESVRALEELRTKAEEKAQVKRGKP